MFSLMKRWMRVVRSTPALSEKTGDEGLISLALAGAVLGEIILCGIIVTRIACKRRFPTPITHNYLSYATH